MPDRVRRIGANDDHVRIGGSDCPHDRGKVGRGWRVGLIVDDFDAGGGGVVARSVGSIAGELGVGGDDCHRGRLGGLRQCHVKEPLGEGELGLRSPRRNDEIVGIVELAVDGEAQQADEHLLAADHQRHGGRQHVGAVATDDQIDLVDVEQLGVDAGDGRRIGLVVIVDELDRATEQAAAGIDVFLPDLLRQQGRLAVGAEAAGHSHAVADLDRLLGRCGLEPSQACKGEHNGPRRRAH